MLYLRRILNRVVISSVFAVVLLLWGCESPGLAATGQATLQGTSPDSNLAGVVNLQNSEAGLQIKVSLSNAPAGEHGFHIHEFGSCAEGGNAAGGHYNPDGVPHGDLVKDGFANAHAGDLGNITVADDGTASYSATVPGLSLTEGKYVVADHAFIVHEKVDDFGQPTGNAGGRIGCGVITLAK